MPNDDDGSNLHGQCHVTFGVAKQFNPLAPETSSLWRTSLERLKVRFEECAQRHGRLSCVLTESTIPQPQEVTEPPTPREVAGMVDIAKKSAVFRDEYIPNDAVRNDSSRSQKGILRSCRIYDERTPKRKESVWTPFNLIAEDAGRCLFGLPTNVNRQLWRDWLDGFEDIGGLSMWLNALFELAWQQVPGSPLFATKFAWDGTTGTSVELPILALGPNCDDLSPGLVKMVEKSTHCYSVLPDLVSASIAATYILLAFGNDAACEPSQSIPGKSQLETINEGMMRLANIFSEGVADDHFKQASVILNSRNLIANEKLTKIDELLRIPPTASANTLGEALGVSKQAVMKTGWWKNNRRGNQNEISNRRYEMQKDRSQQFEADRPDDDDT